MIFEHVTAEEMRAAHIVTGAAMVGLLAARMFGRHARRVMLVVTLLYFAAILLFIVHYSLR